MTEFWMCPTQLGDGCIVCLTVVGYIVQAGMNQLTFHSSSTLQVLVFSSNCHTMILEEELVGIEIGIEELDFLSRLQVARRRP